VKVAKLQVGPGMGQKKRKGHIRIQSIEFKSNRGKRGKHGSR
jgi:hypothetical protein